MEKKRNISKQIMPNELECKILNLVWDGKKGVREIHEVMLEDGYIPYTSIGAAMNNMAQKGLLKQNKNGKAYRYKAAKTKDETVADILDTVVTLFYGEKATVNEIKALIDRFYL